LQVTLRGDDMVKRCWKKATFRSGKTQAHKTCDNHTVIWKNRKYCVVSDYVKLKQKCFTKLHQAKRHVNDWYDENKV